jgi:acetyltransferase-like isoleucine patch superfamily enzyme
MKYFWSFKRRLVTKVRKILSDPIIKVDQLVIGKNVRIDPNVEIKCQRLVLGDGVKIDAGTRIEMTDLVIGDYTHINSNCLFTGDDWCKIGHNCWFGHYSVVNSTGTAQIGNGVCLGVQGQLWSHMYFGDILQGCRFASLKPLVVEDDVWFASQCVVSPIHARRRSLAMSGSVVTHDMEENHVYAGVPASDVTVNLGPQFKEVSFEEKRERMENYLREFLDKYHPSENRIRIVEKINLSQKEFSQFSLTERLYIKNLYPEEVRFMKYLSPTKAKFYPHPETDWVAKYMPIQPL